MNLSSRQLVRVFFIASAFAVPHAAVGVTLQFAGSQANLDNGFFPGGGLPYVTAYWRTSTSDNVYAVGNAYPDQFYGTSGYALFATRFAYPTANDGISDPNLDPYGDDPLFPNLIDLPAWVSESQILAERMAGGFAYSLIDDPRLMADGTRQWTFDGVNYPQAAAGNNTGQNPYVKIGFLDGRDILGNDPAVTPAARWGFTVGADVPAAFRVGVMTDGNDNANFTPAEVFLQQFNGTTPVGSPVGSGTLSGELKDRHFDMHFFDIIGAQPGDSFVLGAMAGAGSFGNSGIAGFSFDVLPTTTASADFNDDGNVDGADFLTWQRGFGTTGTATLGDGDANGDGNVDATDLNVWSEQFGTTGLVAPVANTAPEPTALLLALLAGGMLARRRR
ncbi:MAG: hypothetical protein KDA44_04320 [Planctomycetales bacterium]|nr:hypothetical protein [Planctomycetales bacterium]